MVVALTDQFLKDVSNLPSGLENKCLDLLSSLRKLPGRELQLKAPPGWRFHRLKSSPFVSLSLDMNFRVLCKIDGENVYACRVVKHDVADMPQVNRNANTSSNFGLEGLRLEVRNLYDAISALGVSPASAEPLRQVSNEDELLDALQQVDQRTAELALALYEMSGIAIPRTKFTIVNSDPDLERALFGKNQDWEIYLHPSQRYISNLPVGTRLMVSGSAGTGKTVCAWHRIKQLASQGKRVGFACATNHILSVSKDSLSKMLDGMGEVYFLLPSSCSELLQLCDAVEHIVIDEGQEIVPTWYETIGSHFANRATGITVFYDLNQLGGNIPPRDNKRYEQRLLAWNRSLDAIPNSTKIELSINYRNSREIAKYYSDILAEVLPRPISSDIPVFSAGEVIEHSTADSGPLPELVSHLLLKLQRDFQPSDIAVICPGLVRRDVVAAIQRVNLPMTSDLEKSSGVLVTTPRVIRGHERKAVIFCMPQAGTIDDKWGGAIESYIALSRARDLLIVIRAGR